MGDDRIKPSNDELLVRCAHLENLVDEQELSTTDTGRC